MTFDNGIVMSSRADDFLRYYLTENPGDESGHVEAPTGYFAKVQIVQSEIAEWVSSEGDPWMSERRNFAPGWYIIQVNNLGFVHGFQYPSQEAAQTDFDEADREYEVWAGGQGL